MNFTWPLKRTRTQWLLCSLLIWALHNPTLHAQSTRTTKNNKQHLKQSPPIRPKKTPPKKTTRPLTKKLTPPAPRKKKVAKKAKKKATPLHSQKIAQWLMLGPAPAPLPAFHKAAQGGYKSSALFGQTHLDIQRLKPAQGQKHTWFPHKELTWTLSAGKLKVEHKQPQLAYFATYITVDRYTELKFVASSHQRLRLFLNGAVAGTKGSCSKAPKKGKKSKKASNKTKKKAAPAVPTLSKAHSKDALLLQLTRLLQQQSQVLLEQARTIKRQSKWLSGKRVSPRPKAKAGVLRATLKLAPGTHRLVLKTLYDPGCLPRWGVKASLKGTKKSPSLSGVSLALRLKERHSTSFLLNRKRIVSAVISPNGQEVITWYVSTNTKGKSQWWNELRRLKDGKLLRSFRPHAPFSGMRWSPDGKSYSFVTRQGKKASIWLVNRATGVVRLLRDGLKNFSAHVWSPDSRFLVYSATTKLKSNAATKAGVKRLRGMEDRWPWYRVHSHLYALTADGKTHLRLTAGQWSTHAPVIRADGKKLLFYRSHADYKRRPFRKTSVWELDLTTLKAQKLLGDLTWFNGASYSPKGDKLLLLGSATLFGSIGLSKQLGPKIVPNAYDTQAYIYDLNTKEVKVISRDFSPTIRSGYWHPLDNKIYFSVLDRTRLRLFRYAPESGLYQRISTGVDQATRLSFARNSTRITYIGSGIAHPNRLFTLDLHDPQPQMLYAPNTEWFGRVQLGRVKDWNFRLSDGRQIDGRVYYPPGFQPRKKYPVVVYYYGGTYPSTRSFDGRYPAHLWAAHDYIVYILQPSGAIGFGQHHSSFHVGEWGTQVGGEIIEGTKKFLAAHPYADPKRVGCIGASYGGFMTMYLVTRTKMFAAAVSHAGISNIASYWGGGYWGFLYNAVSAAHLYPWSHPEFYVNQSPLYGAHKVTTPLLLLHGANDTNVPPHESYQMYAALRLLKKPVELVVVKKTDHWVLNYKKRLLWTQTIIAWFDRILKKQPLWWNTLHGTKQH